MPSSRFHHNLRFYCTLSSTRAVTISPGPSEALPGCDEQQWASQQRGRLKLRSLFRIRQRDFFGSEQSSKYYCRNQLHLLAGDRREPTAKQHTTGPSGQTTRRHLFSTRAGSGNCDASRHFKGDGQSNSRRGFAKRSILPVTVEHGRVAE